MSVSHQIYLENIYSPSSARFVEKFWFSGICHELKFFPNIFPNNIFVSQTDIDEWSLSVLNTTEASYTPLKTFINCLWKSGAFFSEKEDSQMDCHGFKSVYSLANT